MENKNYKFFQHKTCECFPCHTTGDIEDFNCLFCYCPLYYLGKKCGGKFIIKSTGIKDCSECKMPHIRGNYDTVINKLIENTLKF